MLGYRKISLLPPSGRPGPESAAAAPATRRLPTLRSRLLLLVAVGAVLVSLLGAGIVLETWESQRARLEDDLQEQARNLARQIDGQFAQVTTGLRTLGNSRALATANLDAFRVEMQDLSREFDGTSVLLTDATGNLLLDTALPDITGVEAATRPAAALLTLRTGKPQIGAARLGIYSRELVMPVYVPVFIGGASKPDYALGLAVPWARMSDLLDTPQLKFPGWVAVVIDNTGVGVARVRQGQTAALGQPSPVLETALRKGHQGIVHNVMMHDGGAGVFAIARGRNSGYTAVIGVPEEVFAAPLLNALLRGSVVLALALAVAGAFALRTANQIVGAVRALVAGQEPGRPPNAAQTYRFSEVQAAADALAQSAARRVRAEAAVRALFDASPVGIACSSTDGRFIDANDMLLDMLGASRADLAAGKLRWDGLTAPEYRAQDAAAMVELRERGAYTPFEKEWLLQDGRRMPVLVAGAMIGDRSDDIAVLIIDLTRLREAEAARHELAGQAEQERARLLALFEALPLGVAIFDETGAVLQANSAFRRFGIERAPSLDPRETAKWRLHPQDAAPPAPEDFVLARALRGVAVQPGVEAIFIETGGPAIWVRVAAVPLPTEPGQPRQAIVVMQNIDAEKRLAEDRLRLNELLEARVRVEVAAREAAQGQLAQAQRMQALGQLAGGIAHDFNNVLQAIQSSAALLERRLDDPRLLRLTGLMLDASERGGSITRRLLAFARQGDLRAETLAPAAVLDDMAEVFARTLGNAIACDAVAAPGLPCILADKGQLQTALVNLATNARDAMPHGGIVTLTAEAETVAPGTPHPARLVPGDYIRISVIDTGLGMDTDTLARVTEPFFTTKQRGQGTGLGLAMAKGFSEQSGGGLVIESRPESGTAVMLWLPQAPAGASPDMAARASAPIRFDPGLPPPRVMLVDDNVVILNTTGTLIEEAGCTLLRFESPLDALNLLERGQSVDVLVTDLSMPGLDGMGLAHAARRMLPGLPVVLLTGYAGDTTAHAAEEIGPPFALLRKPVSAFDIMGQVASLLAARAEARE